VEDHLLHKLGLALTITPPANSNSGVSSVTVNFSVTLSDINQTQTITAPTNAKPISGLLGQLGIGGLGAIGVPAAPAARPAAPAQQRLPEVRAEGPDAGRLQQVRPAPTAVIQAETRSTSKLRS